MFTQLAIERFKGIRQGQLTELAPVNVLIGKNNSGKSTVLEALVLARSAVVGVDYFEKDGLRDIFERRMQRPNYDFAELWYKRETGEPIRIGVSQTDPVEIKIRENIIYIGTSQIHFDVEWKSSRGQSSIGINGPLGTRMRDVGSNPFLRDWKSQAGEGAVSVLPYIHLVDPHLLREPVVEKVWEEIITWRKDKELVQAINTIYGLSIEYLAPTGAQNRLYAAMPTYGVPIDWLGDGLKYAIVVLSAAALLQGTALLLEELESHQHPESLKLLVDALFLIAKRKRLQLFLATHSAELITYVLDASENHGLASKVYHLNLSKDGLLEARGISAPDAKVLADIGYDIRMHDKYLKVQ